jgi:hypothetical protein
VRLGAGILVVLAALAALVTSGCGLSDPYRTDTQESAAQPAGAAPAPARRPMAQPDREDTDPALRARRERELSGTPALQHLPYRQGDVSIDFGDVAPDGRLGLTVIYSGTAAAAHASYRGFLRRWGDSGRGYVVSYLRGPSEPAREEPLAALRVSPEAALRAVALAAGNWSAASVSAAYSRAIALSVGAARADLRHSAAQMRAGVERVGPSLRSHAAVTAIDLRGSGDSRHAVVVTRQGISGGDQPGGGYEYQVTLATVELRPSGWAVSSWEPQP